jgi:AcrR family transcriptional regulator
VPVEPHDAGVVADHRSRPRRRGRALDEAIYRATLDELSEHGYAKLTMEGVADRARAGKASLYRRWPTRAELVLDAVAHHLPDPFAAPDTGSLRGDLVALLRAIAALLEGPAGEALRGVLGDVMRDPVATAEARRRTPGAARRAMEEVARRAAARGEIAAAAIRPRRLEAGVALLRHQFLVNGVPIPDAVIVEIVDDVIVPLLTAPLADASTAR